ncbi:Proline-rich protein 12, partial [Stegodyphus mimosarum]
MAENSDMKEENPEMAAPEISNSSKLKIKTELDTSLQCDEQLPNMPKKRGRKAKKPPAVKTDAKKRKSSVKSPDPINNLAITIKQEIVEEVAFESSRRSSLRSRKSDSTLKEVEAGPSIKKEPIELSDDEVDIIDDSDSDPAWTPSAKTPKATDHLKSHGIQCMVKKRGPKVGSRRSSAGNAPAAKRERKKSRESQPRKTSTEKSVPATICKKEILEPVVKVRKEKERFLVAKADINKPTPFLWRVDKETNMLQRFEWFEQDGMLLYRSTYTYAAWNEISFSNYVTANVKIVSHNRVVFIVEYLGPALNEPAEEFSDENVAAPPDPLRENFEVFLQTLISQALDPNFLSEITNENDEYFLSNIKEIEQVSEAKKSTLMKDTWDEELQKCANTYPCLNILDSITNEMKCQVCDKENGIKLLQFYGQPYDWTTLGSVEMPLATKTQFNACCRCSATVSLYNRLHHQKYNFFIKCRTKMNEVKGDSEKVESHVLLEDCLQDHAWVNTLYSELEQTWRECEEKS